MAWLTCINPNKSAIIVYTHCMHNDGVDDGALPKGRKAGSLAFTTPRDEKSEVVSHCLPHRQLWVCHLSKVATRCFQVDSIKPVTLPLQGTTEHTATPLVHCVPLCTIRGYK